MITGFAVLFVVGCVIAVAANVAVFRAVKARERAVAIRELAPPVEKPSRDALTMSERWSNEQDHLLCPDKPREFYQHKICRVCGPGPLGRYEVPSKYDHVFRGRVEYRDDYGFPAAMQGVVSAPSEADVVTSQIEGSKLHTLMLDIDLPARLVESSTPGCSHLYIDAPMTWRQLQRVLTALQAAGVLEDGFVKASLRNGATHLRVPWKDKE